MRMLFFYITPRSVNTRVIGMQNSAPRWLPGAGRRAHDPVLAAPGLDRRRRALAAGRRLFSGLRPRKVLFTHFIDRLVRFHPICFATDARSRTVATAPTRERMRG